MAWAIDKQLWVISYFKQLYQYETKGLSVAS